MSILATIICSILAIVNFYFFYTVPKRGIKIRSFLFGFLLFIPMASVLAEDNSLLFCSKNIVFLFTGVVVVVDGFIDRVFIKKVRVVEVFLGLIILIPVVYTILRLVMIKCAS